MKRAERMRRARGGWTILQVCAVMIVGSTIYGISVQILSVALRSSEAERENALTIATQARLAERFRADVHAARAIEIASENGNKLRWTIKLADDERVEFELKNGRLNRAHYRGGEVLDRDAFLLPNGSTPRLELIPREHPTEACLLFVESADDGDDTAAHTLRINARIGHDRRLSVISKPTEKTQ